ncbi:MAG: hypothetical protein AAGL11_00080 [Pseudomonadota bacterium]
MARPFSFDNAAFHFARAEGPSGFIPKYLLTYAIGVALIGALSFFALQPLIDGYIQAFAMIAQGASEARVAREIEDVLANNLGRIGLGYLAIMLAYAVFWAMMESAVLRRYVREEGFSIGWGGDEWRMLAVGLMWLVAFIVAYIAFVIAVAIAMVPLASSVQNDPGPIILIVVALVLALMFAWAFVAVKLSPAGAMTIRDRSVTFFGAWGATKGRFWPMLGAFVILGLILYVGILILYFIGAFAVMGSVMGNVNVSNGEVDPNDVIAAFSSPAVWGPIALIYFMMLVYQGVWQYAWAGVPSLAAKTDPRTGGMHDAAEQF